MPQGPNVSSTNPDRLPQVHPCPRGQGPRRRLSTHTRQMQAPQSLTSGSTSLLPTSAFWNSGLPRRLHWGIHCCTTRASCRSRCRVISPEAVLLRWGNSFMLFIINYTGPKFVTSLCLGVKSSTYIYIYLSLDSCHFLFCFYSFFISCIFNHTLQRFQKRV